MAQKRKQAVRGKRPKCVQLSKVPYGTQFLYTFDCHGKAQKAQKIQVVAASDHEALKMAEVLCDPSSHGYAYGSAYAYGDAYGYHYGSAYGYGYGA